MKRSVLSFVLLFTMVLSVSMLFASESKAYHGYGLSADTSKAVTSSATLSGPDYVVNYNYINEFSTSHKAGRLFVEASSNCGGCHKELVSRNMIGGADSVFIDRSSDLVIASISDVGSPDYHLML